MNNLEVRWIIEKDVLSYTDRLVTYLKEKDIFYKETTYQEVASHSYKDVWGYLDDAEVATIFVGSLRLAKEINRYPVFPGAICNLKNFDCLNYYPSWNDYLLNKDWTITVPPILKRHCKEGDTTKKFFFRPNDEGNKTFTGGLFTKSELVKLRLEESKVIIQASKKEIVDEYRFLVVDRKIVDYTRYSNSPKSEMYQGAKLLLEDALHKGVFKPDRAFTVDMGETNNGRIGVIELNSFSCANLYSMNMGKVVPAINDLAKQMYIENND